MATSTEQAEHPTVSRGLLTPGEREFLRGEKDVENPDAYLYNIRSRFRERMNELDDDLELLRAAGEDELVDDFFQEFGRVERLEREIESLRERVDDED